MNETYVPLDRPRDFTSTLSAVVDILRITWRRLLSDVVVMAGVWMLIGGVLIGIVARSYFSILLDPTAMQLGPDTAELVSSFILFVVAFVLLMIGSFMEIVVVLAFFRAYHQLRRVPDRAEVRVGMRDLWPRTLGTIVLMVIILGVAFVALLIPGIYLMVPFMMLLPVRTFEEMSFGNAVTRSFQLTRDRWWWTLGIYVCATIATSILNGVTSIPYFAFSMATAVMSAQGETSDWVLIGQAVTLVLQYITSYILQVITLVGVVVVYFAHRERLDGTSLLARVDQIGATDAA